MIGRASKTMSNERLTKIINSFKDKKICVVGDLMIDHYIVGDSYRISPEAPVPVVHVKHELFVPGGAGNVAANVATLGGHAVLVGVIGKDLLGNELMRELRDYKINTEGLVQLSYKPTTQKTRVIARGQQIVRFDKESKNYIGNAVHTKLLKFIEKHIAELDGVVISDYDKGLFTEDFAKKLVSLSNKYKKPIIADVKPTNARFVKKVTLLTPNYKEAVEISGSTEVKVAGRIIQKKCKCNVLITQGEGGMTLFHGTRTKHLPTVAQEVYDVIGAGDTVASTMILSLASGANLQEAALISNHAAGIVCGKRGTAAVSTNELKHSLQNSSHT